MEPVTLNVRTEQEAFDKVSAHLAAMTGRSMSPDKSRCAYRGHDGRKCAIGILIDDDDAAKSFDEADDSVIGKLIMYGQVVTNVSRSFLDELQVVHDSPYNWNTSDQGEELGFSSVGVASLERLVSNYRLLP
jgi:hypothetical protein